MSTSIYNISLDLHKTQSQVHLAAFQGDTDREVHISLHQDNKPYNVGKNVLAVWSTITPNGNVIEETCGVVVNNKLVYKFSKELTAAAGNMDVSIRIYDGSELISTPSLTLCVAPRLNIADTVVASDSFKSLDELYTKINNMLNDGTFKGDAAGFGEVTATATGIDPTMPPTVNVSTSGDNTAKNFAFDFGIPTGASPIKKSVSGTILKLTDVSPAPHTLKVKAKSENLFNIDVKPDWNTREDATLTKINATTLHTTASSFSGSGNGIRIGKFPAGTKLTIGFDWFIPDNLLSAGGYLISGMYSKQTNEKVDKTLNFSGQSGHVTHTITIPEANDNDDIYFRPGYGVALKNGYYIALSNIMIVIGDTEKDYAPYMTRFVKCELNGNLHQNDGTETGIKAEEVLRISDFNKFVTRAIGKDIVKVYWATEERFYIDDWSGDSDSLLSVWGLSSYGFGEDGYVEIDILKANVIRGNGDDDTEPTYYPINEDGTVDGVISLYPTTTLTSDTEGIALDVEYNVDTQKYIDKKFAELQALLLEV